MKPASKPRILTIAGSDSGGGAGIQADLKTIMAMGGYGMSAITAITAQNTLRLTESLLLEPALVLSQIKAVTSDIGVDAVKTGMVGNAETISAIAPVIAGLDVPFVLDPVMLSTSGDSLLEPAAMTALIRELIPACTVITPNIPEAESLTGMAVDSIAAMGRAAEKLLQMGPQAVLIKGGHMAGRRITDLLLWSGGNVEMTSDRIDSRNTHGTGCTLASGIACGLGAGLDLVDAVKQAREYVRHAILAAPGFGGGHGPMDHGWSCPAMPFAVPPQRA